MNKILLFAVPVMGLTLSGCVLDDLRTGPSPHPPAATSEAEKPAPTASLSEPARPVQPVQPAQPAKPAKPQPPAPDPSIVIGMMAGELRDLLGPPAFRRRDKPAEIWRYTSSGCVLDVFLYEAAGGGPVSATHFEVRGRGKTPVAAKACFTDMLNANKRQQSG